jgi:ParB-like nuclease domain.
MGLTDMLDANTKVIKKPILKNIEIEDIVTNELNIETIKEIEELKSSILQFGLMKPLEVYESEKGIYKLLGGERRYTALSSLIKEEKYDSEIPCLIYQHQGEVVERLMMLA